MMHIACARICIAYALCRATPLGPIPRNRIALARARTVRARVHVRARRARISGSGSPFNILSMSCQSSDPALMHSIAHALSLLIGVAMAWPSQSMSQSGHERSQRCISMMYSRISWCPTPVRLSIVSTALFN